MNTHVADPPATVSEVAAATMFRVLLNAGALLGAYVVPRALTFAAALTAARMLQPAAFGVYGAAAALAMMLSIVCTLGMHALLVREMARAPDRAHVLLAAAHRIRGVAAAAMFVAFLVAAGLLALPPDAFLAALLLCAGHACWAFAENYGARLQAQERMRVWLEANVVFGVSAAVLAGTAVVMTRSVPWFCAGMAAGQVLALAYLIVRGRGGIEEALPREGVSRAVRQLLGAVPPFALAFLALTVFYKFDVLLLAQLRDTHAAGIYSAGYKFVDVAHALAVVGAVALYPRLARGAGGGITQCRVLELCVLAVVPAAALLGLGRVPLVNLMFGADYAGASHALGLLAPAAALLAVNILAGYVLAAERRVTAMAAAYAAALACKVVLGVVWMPAHGAEGAAAAMLVSEVAATIALSLALLRARVRLPRPVAVAPAAAAALLAIACGVLFDALPAIAVFSAGCVLTYAAGDAIPAHERAGMALVLRRIRAVAREAS